MIVSGGIGSLSGGRVQRATGGEGSSQSAEPATIAQNVLRRYARLTNLVLASTPVAVLGVGPVADELATILRRIGAQLITVETQVPPEVQLLIIVGPDSAVPGIAAADRPLLLICVDDDLDREWFTELPGAPARPGIEGRRGSREIFWLDAAW